MTALVENTTRQLCAFWQWWYATFATGWHYRATREVSSGVGCPAMGAERLAMGRVTGTTALVAATIHAGTPSTALMPDTGHANRPWTLSGRRPFGNVSELAQTLAVCSLRLR